MLLIFQVFDAEGNNIYLLLAKQLYDCTVELEKYHSEKDENRILLKKREELLTTILSWLINGESFVLLQEMNHHGNFYIINLNFF
jgi:hypothetical protein